MSGLDQMAEDILSSRWTISQTLDWRVRCDSLCYCRTDGSTVFSRLFQVVTSLLQVGLSPLPGPASSSSSSLFSSKVGQTAGSLSQEQAAHQQQVKLRARVVGMWSSECVSNL